MQQITYNNLTWVDIQDPKVKDINFLRENFNFHELVLEELIPPSHRPKVEVYEKYLFMVLYYPAFNRAKKKTFPRELDIIVTNTHLITSHYRTIIPLKTLFDQVNLHDKAKKEYLSQTTGHLLFSIIRGILENTLTKLEHIDKQVEYIEDKIFKGEERKMVLEISEAKRDVIDFRRILAPQTSILESLAVEGPKFFGPELEPYFADLRGSFGIVWNDLQDHRETINALAETNESLLYTKTSETIRILTVFSAVFFPLTLIASIWGMNIPDIPFTANAKGFWIVTAAMLAALFAMVGFFRKKKWL